MLRVAELIRHAVSQVLTRGGVNDPALETEVITVSGVKMSPDLKLATVLIVPLGGKDPTAVLAALERNRKFIRGAIAGALNLKFMPDLRFRQDEGFATQARIDALLHSEKVLRDLDSKNALDNKNYLEDKNP